MRDVDTVVEVVARCDELDDVFVLADARHERDFVEHQLSILVVVTACKHKHTPVVTVSLTSTELN